jgi:DNA-binding NtrC family response regulator
MKSILVIDDDDQFRKMLKLLLERHGFTVIATDQAKKGFDVLQATHVDLVITDIVMPETEGMETILALKKLGVDVPVIAVSGGTPDLNANDLLETANLMGAHWSMKKPIQRETFLEKVYELLGMERSRQTIDEEKKDGEEPQPQEIVTEKPAAVEKNRGRILVIDDDVQFRRMLSQFLTRNGFAVSEAKDGSDGIQKYRENPAKLVITDIVMENKDGVETIYELKQAFPDVPIFAVSGDPSFDPEFFLRMAKKAGADKTFTKPLDRNRFLDDVNSIFPDQ